jgi:hypothetical protein
MSASRYLTVNPASAHCCRGARWGGGQGHVNGLPISTTQSLGTRLCSHQDSLSLPSSFSAPTLQRVLVFQKREGSARVPPLPVPKPNLLPAQPRAPSPAHGLRVYVYSCSQMDPLEWTAGDSATGHRVYSVRVLLVTLLFCYHRGPDRPG